MPKTKTVTKRPKDAKDNSQNKTKTLEETTQQNIRRQR